MKTALLWRIIYRLYPPCLRILEKLGVHRQRQPYRIGFLKPNRTAAELQKFLESRGFEPAVLAWRDPGELLSLRKIDKQIFQYHLRLFADGEIRGHYEYSSEGNPLAHIREKCFAARRKYFLALLKAYLKK